MKNKLKIISIFSIVLAIIIAFTSSVNAVSTTYVTYPEDGGVDVIIKGETYHIDFGANEYFPLDDNHNFKNYFCYSCSDGYRLLLSDTDIYIKEDFSWVNTDTDSGKVVYWYGKMENGSNTFKGSLGKNYFSGSVPDGFEFLYSNCDIKDPFNGKVVFQPTPAVVLAPIAQEAPLEGIVQEIVGILPIVLIILVGLIGLRKGLALLSQTLHKA